MYVYLDRTNIRNSKVEVAFYSNSFPVIRHIPQKRKGNIVVNFTHSIHEGFLIFLGGFNCLLQSHDFLPKQQAIEQLAHNFSQYLSARSKIKWRQHIYLRLKMSLNLKMCPMDRFSSYLLVNWNSRFTPLQTTNLSLKWAQITCHIGWVFSIIYLYL